MGDQFLIADVLSFEGNHIMRSSSLKCTIETLDLFVSQLHLREVFKINKLVTSLIFNISVLNTSS